MEVNSKEVRDASRRARRKVGSSSLTRRKWTEKIKNPRKDLLTRTVPGNVTSRDSSVRYHEEPHREKLNGVSGGSQATRLRRKRNEVGS